jgi:N-acetylneuraminate synthase
MDFCHLFMGASYFNFKVEDVLKKLKPLIKHVHLSEASGFDGEGMQFGEGDQGQTKIIGDYLSMDCMKVIEVWQGHLDQGAGFRQAIERLQKFYG